DPASPRRRAHVQALHLADALSRRAEGDAAGHLVVEPGHEQPAGRPRVRAGKRRKLFVEALEAEVDAESRRVLEEERLRRVHAGVGDRQVRYSSSSVTGTATVSSPP